MIHDNENLDEMCHEFCLEIANNMLDSLKNTIKNYRNKNIVKKNKSSVEIFCNSIGYMLQLFIDSSIKLHEDICIDCLQEYLVECIAMHIIGSCDSHRSDKKSSGLKDHKKHNHLKVVQ